MVQKLEKEVWISAFAIRLAEVQPRFPPNIAADVALGVWPHLLFIPPKQAVPIFLQAMKARQPLCDFPPEPDGGPSPSA